VKGVLEGTPRRGRTKKRKEREPGVTLGMLRRKMKLESLPEQLFTSVVGMDPLLDGFSGVLVEIYRERESSGGFRYVLLETASGTGNQILRFSSKDRELVYAALAREIGSSLQ
jgi:hypothetical protein